MRTSQGCRVFILTAYTSSNVLRTMAPPSPGAHLGFAPQLRALRAPPTRRARGGGGFPPPRRRGPTGQESGISTSRDTFLADVNFIYPSLMMKTCSESSHLSGRREITRQCICARCRRTRALGKVKGLRGEDGSWKKRYFHTVVVRFTDEDNSKSWKVDNAHAPGKGRRSG